MSHPAPSPALRRARLAVNLMFFTNGALFANLLPRWPGVKDSLALDATAFGLLVACYPFGAMIAGPSAGTIVRRLTSARTALLGTSMVGAVLFGAGLAASTSATVMGLALFVAGACDAIVDVGQNAHGLRVQRGYGRSIINSFHAAWSAGAVTGGLMGSAALALALPLPIHLAISGALFSAVALYAYTAALPGPDVDDAANHPSREARAGRNHVVGAIAALSVIALAGTVVEDSGSTWSAIYLRDVVGAHGGVLGFAFVAMVGAQFVGRLTGDRSVDRRGRRAVARTGGLLIAAGMSAALLWPSTPLTLLGFAFAGYGSATLVPAAFDAADRLPGLKPGSGLTIIGWLMRLAFLIGPPLVGTLTDAFGLRIGLGVVPAGALALLAAVRVLPGPASSPASTR
ncbi:MAG: MFS transporter [Bowdeniella nasicola]|nr:MFS transporter [Bowdeniella nasicola]